MAKLTDDMKAMRVRASGNSGPGERSLSMRGEGGPCPFCNGERKVASYFAANVRARKHDKNESQKGFSLVMPGFWQGCCVECGEAILLELAERAGRTDYIKKIKGDPYA